MAERPGTELIVKRRERLFVRKHARVLKKVAARPRRDSDSIDVDEYLEIPNGNTRGKLRGTNVKLAERAASARPGGTVQLKRVIERIIADAGAAAAAANVRPPSAPSSIALISVRPITRVVL